MFLYQKQSKQVKVKQPPPRKASSDSQSKVLINNVCIDSRIVNRVPGRSKSIIEHPKKGLKALNNT